MGWASRGTFQLNGPNTLIDCFQMSSGAQTLIYGTPTDLYNDNGANPVYITPAYTVGSITAVSGTSVTGTGTFWNIPIGGNFVGFTSVAGSAGDTAITLLAVPAGLKRGELVGASPYIQVGTTVAAIVGNSIVLSLPLSFNLPAGTEIIFGGQLANFRKNVRPGDQIAFNSNQNSPAAQWFTVKSVNSNTTLTLTVPAPAYSGPYTVRQCATPWAAANPPFGAYVNFWDSETFPQAGLPYNKDMWFATNGEDPLIAWDGISQFASYVTTVPFISQTVHRHKNLMVYGGLVGANGQQLPTSIANSDNGTPTVMAGGVAFQGSVSDGPFQINHLATLGGVLMIYMSGTNAGASHGVSTTGGSVVSATFLGFPNIWAFSEVIRSRGPLSGSLVAEFPDRHQFLATDGMYRYNGLFIQVMNDHIWRSVLQNFDPSRAQFGFATINQTYGDLHWVVPLTTDGTQAPVTAYTEHYMEQANSFLFKPYTQRDFPFLASGVFPGAVGWTWPQFNVPWTNFQVPFDTVATPASLPMHLVGDISGRIYQLYTGQTKAGTPITSFAQWPKRLVGNGRGRDLVTRVYPELETGTGLVNIILTLYDSISGPPTIIDTQVFDTSYPSSSDGTVFRYTKHWRRGRVGQVQFNSTVPWIADGYDWDEKPGGLR